MLCPLARLAGEAYGGSVQGVSGSAVILAVIRGDPGKKLVSMWGKVLLACVAFAALAVILVMVIYPGAAPACLPAGGGHPPASVHQCDPYITPSP